MGMSIGRIGIGVATGGLSEVFRSDPFGQKASDSLNIPALSGLGVDSGKFLQDLFSQAKSLSPDEQEVQSTMMNMFRTGFAPSEADFSSAARLFKPRQTALDQMFKQQQMDASSLATKLGRSVSDPILQARLRTGFMQQQDMLESEKTAAAQSLLFQRLNLGQQASSMGFNKMLQASPFATSALGTERGFQQGTATTEMGLFSKLGVIAGGAGSVMGGIGKMKGAS